MRSKSDWHTYDEAIKKNSIYADGSGCGLAAPIYDAEDDLELGATSEEESNGEDEESVYDKDWSTLPCGTNATSIQGARRVQGAIHGGPKMWKKFNNMRNKKQKRS